MPAMVSMVVVHLVYIGRRPRREKFGLYEYIRTLAQFSSRLPAIAVSYAGKLPFMTALFRQRSTMSTARKQLRKGVLFADVSELHVFCHTKYRSRFRPRLRQSVVRFYPTHQIGIRGHDPVRLGREVLKTVGDSSHQASRQLTASITAQKDRQLSRSFD